MLLRRITYLRPKFATENSSGFFGKFDSRNIQSTTVLEQKKKRGNWFSRIYKRKRNTTEDCDEAPASILDPLCKVAIVVGGAEGFGFAAANYLLLKGSRVVLIADKNAQRANIAARRLCDAHGTERAKYLQCDIQNIRDFENALMQASHKYNQIHILFNDLDKRRYFLSRCNNKEQHNSNITKRIIEGGMKIMGKQNGGFGGAIVNSASILGFMGWPQDPLPVYCMKEPAIETTIDLAKEFNTKTTGVRLMTLCPMNKPFYAVSLPDFPEATGTNGEIDRPLCIPRANWRIGAALCHVLAEGTNGSTWVVEPGTCPNVLPYRVNFPGKQDEKVTRKVCKDSPCVIALKSYSPDILGATSASLLLKSGENATRKAHFLRNSTRKKRTE